MFEPAQAGAFGGPVLGVEPSEHMRGIAERERSNGSYLVGSAEKIPVSSGLWDRVRLRTVSAFEHLSDEEFAPGASRS